MNDQLSTAVRPLHPLVMGAAASVILVSLLGAAAITGVIPSSHGSAGIGSVPPAELVANAAPAPVTAPTAYAAPSERYVLPDGRMVDVVPPSHAVVSPKPVRLTRVDEVAPKAPVRTRHMVHHHAPRQDAAHDRHDAGRYEQVPLRSTPPVDHAPTRQPVRAYVADMHPVGTGVGAVVGGLIGNQIGGGNGKKLATVAGVLLGGYAGNEVAHNRSPLPW